MATSITRVPDKSLLIVSVVLMVEPAEQPVNTKHDNKAITKRLT